ncbi:ABC transporter permease [Zhouia spongiae]|uniref:ABC transporter permease n=1 Tax=Zhouia spongiae TaxID=2202721 RepID=A0ABY3YL69_9FLAO|nr:ABC transporter permease [Zhouia spongiae]UNY98579.1 ABC transporter permease [Zhouia spongiae]
MLFKILREYLRRITRNYKIYAVSILGMSVAIVASFHIYHFVYKELSVDTFHSKRKEIYRVLQTRPSSSNRSEMTPPPMGRYLKDKLPEVNDYARVLTNNAPISLVLNGEKTEQEIMYVEPSFFDLFDFKLIEGNLQTFKDDENSIILSQRKARELFKNGEALGKVLKAYNNSSSQDKEYLVAGIIENIPKNATLQSDVFLNIKSHPLISYTDTREEVGWRIGIADLYLHLPHVEKVKDFANKIGETLYTKAKNGGVEEVDENNFMYELQRLDNIYFDSFDITNQKKKGSKQFIGVLILIGSLTLLLAVFNYVLMNLGLSLNRTGEFRIRRNLGISKLNIYVLLLFESVFNILICFILTLLTYPFLNSVFNKLIKTDYEFSWHNDKMLIVSYLLIIFVVGLVIGTLEFAMSYKAIFVNRKNENGKWGSSWFSKKVIIGFQLVLLIGLMSSIFLIRKQVQYIETKDLGFDKNVVTVSPYGVDGEVLMNELKAKSYINDVAVGDILFRSQFNLEDIEIRSSKNQIKGMMVRGDTNYLKTYNLKLIQGRNIKSTRKPIISNTFQVVGWTPEKTDELIEVIVNEEFVKRANLKKPLGTVFTSTNINNAIIVGVFKNIYNTPLYSPVYPVIIGYGFDNFPMQFLQVSYDENHKEELIQLLLDIKKEETYNNNTKDNILHKVDYESVYEKELQLKKSLEAFTVIVLFISLLGLVAISLFMTESKTKEIGIRKVNGAAITEIMLLLNKDFVKWVGIAFVIACPISYYAMSRWLENFAHKTALSWWVFASAGLCTLVIALFTVSWQTYRAATRNPVESLRDE